MRRYSLGVLLAVMLAGCKALPADLPSLVSQDGRTVVTRQFELDGLLCWEEMVFEKGQAVSSATACEQP